jgi:L-threonylcarbamoyladenylate synthase
VIDQAVAAIEAGEVVVLPTDTVYGLVATPFTVVGRDALYRLKGRDAGQPSALVASSVERLLEYVPEFAGRSEAIVRALLPGPFTLVLPNPAGRFAWLCGGNVAALGVRVPAVTGPGLAVLEQVGAVVATSANLPGGAEPRRLADVSCSRRRGGTARQSLHRARPDRLHAARPARWRGRRRGRRSACRVALTLCIFKIYQPPRHPGSTNPKLRTRARSAIRRISGSAI